MTMSSSSYRSGIRSYNRVSLGNRCPIHRVTGVRSWPRRPSAVGALPGPAVGRGRPAHLEVPPAPPRRVRAPGRTGSSLSPSSAPTSSHSIRPSPAADRLRRPARSTGRSSVPVRSAGVDQLDAVAERVVHVALTPGGRRRAAPPRRPRPAVDHSSRSSTTSAGCALRRAGSRRPPRGGAPPGRRRTSSSRRAASGSGLGWRTRPRSPE